MQLGVQLGDKVSIYRKMEDKEDDQLFSKTKRRIKRVRWFGTGYLGQCFSTL